MKIEDVNLAIANSPSIAWFNERDINIDFINIRLKLNFKTVSAFSEYIFNQYAGWQNLSDNMPEELNKSKELFRILKEQFVYFIQNFVGENPQNLIVNWETHVFPHISNLRHSLTYDCPETPFLLDLLKNNIEQFRGAFEFINGSVGNLKNKDTYLGTLFAFEFTRNNTTKIKERGELEEQSINNLKGDFLNYLSNSEGQVSNHIAKVNGDYQEFATRINDFKDSKELEVNTWYDRTKHIIESFHTTSSENILTLEKTYEELLRLKKPAEYWNKRAEKLNKEGWNALKWLVGLIVFGTITLYILLWLTPEGMLKSFFNEDKGIAVRWSIVYITFISLLAFGIRAISKVMFSSFHLSRDAEEREQLTFVYLALIKDNAIEKGERTLIMQSLFSRADSGLLREDSSPTMPSGIVDKFIK
ncbi:MAG: hypothetical protein K9H61_05730 [Bacteroidia bacterium]|nr:hypothetical protein [Bacteroidia bacterium]MCF8427029.1 hypothetical protein [Bacteroidia bacterium]MCF8446477.1 hypothetical protein [Bacteroidia bacterium]